MRIINVVKASTVVLGLSAVVLSSRCTREYIQPVNGICFQRDVLPILVSNCTQSGCHNSQDRVQGLDFSTYDNILQSGVIPGDYKGSAVYHAITGSGGESMPPSPYERLTSEQIQTIALWIDEGAKNTTCDEGACNTANASFSQQVQPIMQKWCNGCHAGSNPSGGINTATYTGLKTVAVNGSLVGSIEHTGNYSPMPQNAGKLSSCDIAVIKQWVADGTPNN